MNDVDEPPRPSGLPVGTQAPFFDTTDVYGNKINLREILTDYKGLIIDFFRGNW